MGVLSDILIYEAYMCDKPEHVTGISSTSFFGKYKASWLLMTSLILHFCLVWSFPEWFTRRVIPTWACEYPLTLTWVVGYTSDNSLTIVCFSRYDII